MVMTNAERQKRFRERRDADPEKRQKYLQRGRERYRNNCKSGKQKPVSELSDRDKEAIRKRWREQKQKDRLRQKHVTQMSQCIQTPPSGPDEVPTSARKKQQIKKKKQMQVNTYREKRKLEAEKQFLKKKLDTCDRRVSRSQEESKQNDTPCKQTTKLLPQWTPKEAKGSLSKSQGMIEAIRKKYKEQRKRERACFSRYICYKNLRKYNFKTETYKLVTCYSSNKTTKRYHNISKRLGERIHAFYIRNDNSRLITGKRQTKTFKREIKQRRVLLYELKTLHQKFLSEDKTKISYSVFCRLRPFFVTFPRRSNRNTCICKICNNTEMMAEALKKAKVFETDDLNDLIGKLVCDMKQKECMYGECDACVEKSLVLDKNFSDEVVIWYEWKSKREVRTIQRGNSMTEKVINITVKECQNGTVETLFDKFEIQLKRYTKHLFRRRHQYKYFAKRKSGINDDESLLHIYFFKTYMCGYKSEIQSVHFGGSNKQLTLHTGVTYVKDQDPLAFCSVSDSLKYGPEAVWAHLEPVMTDIRQKYPHIRKIEIFSDGPVTQYRHKGNFYLASVKGYSYGFEDVIWSFFESGHEGGVPNAIWGVVKRQANNFIKYGGDVVSAVTFCSAMSKESKIKMYLVADRNIKEIRGLLEKVVLKALPGIMNFHQVRCSPNDSQIAYRNLSCHCTINNEHKGHGYEKARIINERKGQSPPNLGTKVLKNQSEKLSTLRESNRNDMRVSLYQEELNTIGTETKKRADKILQKSSKRQSKRKLENNDTHDEISKRRMPRKKNQSGHLHSHRDVESNRNFRGLLHALNKCECFEDLNKLLCRIPHLEEVGNVDQRCIYLNKLEVDNDSIADIPDEFENTCLYPAMVNTNGNCLPSCGSVFAFGTPNRAEELRTYIIKELCENEEYYLDGKNLAKGLKDNNEQDLPSQYAQYSDYFIPGTHLTKTRIQEIFRKEVMSLTTNKSFMGIWQIFALASILKAPIQSVYPAKGDPNIRRALNRLILPRTKQVFQSIFILWTNTRRDISNEHWVPNHFVPLLPNNLQKD